MSLTVLQRGHPLPKRDVITLSMGRIYRQTDFGLDLVLMEEVLDRFRGSDPSSATHHLHDLGQVIFSI